METRDVDLDAACRRLDERAAEHRFSGLAVVWRDGAPVFEQPPASRAAGTACRSRRAPGSTSRPSRR